MKSLSEKMLKDTEEYIKSYVESNNGKSPSLIQIADCLGVAKSVAYRYVKALDERGIVHYSGKRTLSVDGEKYKRSNIVRLPILGSVICGSPAEQEQYIEGYVAIPEEWVDGECFLLRAYGDSMTDIGIDKGDLVLVKKTETANDGDVVVALTEDGNTLKRLFWENGKPRLHAENKTYTRRMLNFYPRELTIQGIALKVIKDIR